MAIKNIDSATLKNWLDNNQALLIDVREPAEYEANNIKGSQLISLANVSLKNLPEIGNKKLVLHCQGGKRSFNGCQKLISENEDLEIYNLEGGISAWIQQGYNFQSSKKFFLPIDRQVQVIIGSATFLTTIAGYFISNKFFIIPMVLGAGLIFAGLSGYCGLAILVAKMPWNKGVKKLTLVRLIKTIIKRLFAFIKICSNIY